MPPGDTAAQAAGDAAAAGGLPGANWRKARSSGAENGGCVEIAGGPRGLTAIRDSRRPHDGVHLVPAAAFAAFLADAKAGAYDMERESADLSRAAEPDNPGPQHRGQSQSGGPDPSFPLRE